VRYSNFRSGVILTGLLALAVPVWAQDQPGEGIKKPAMPRVGQAALDFTLKDADGKAVNLKKANRKKWVVLYFFPKAMTPG